MRQIGNEKYLSDDGSYTVYVSVEIRKSSMYRHLKKQARLDKTIKPSELKQIEEMLDELIKTAEAED
jgi:hypothetical protein